MADENMTPETEVNTPQASGSENMMPRADAENLLKALKAERESRKQYEKQVKEQAAQLERFADVNPDEWSSMQAELAKASQLQQQFSESRDAIELKYSQQAEASAKEAAASKTALQEYQKKYALEKVFNEAGGRTDSADGVSFFDMIAQQVGGNFRLEPDGSLTVLDSGGDPVLDKESGKRITAQDYIGAYKTHPIYGTFFKGTKTGGAGIGYGGTDANGMVIEDFSSMTREEKFLNAFPANP
mgnify:FL=1|tara:strand:+ start:567 stop:1295 length:729 start_codon:yes stop_codon:yes gene_type:complete